MAKTRKQRSNEEKILILAAVDYLTADPLAGYRAFLLSQSWGIEPVIQSASGLLRRLGLGWDSIRTWRGQDLSDPHTPEETEILKWCKNLVAVEHIKNLVAVEHYDTGAAYAQFMAEELANKEAQHEV